MTSPTQTRPDLPAADDQSAASARLRSVSGLVGSVSTAYTAAHGHPMDHEGLVTAETSRRRWSVGLRVALVAGTCLVVLAGGVVASQIASTPAEVVALDDADPAYAQGEAATGQDGAQQDESAGAAEVPPAAQGPVPDGGGTGAPTGTVLVHVVGQVLAPGVVEVPEGSRVIDAIGVAGGFTAGADTAAVNLARAVVDGEQVYVPAPGEGPPTLPGTPPAAGSGPGAPATVGLVDVNTATVDQLDTLPGIGPALAERIVQWRSDNGRFAAVDELADVAGIGPSVLGKIRDLVTV